MGRPKCFDRNEVLDAAIQLFWKKGFADTSLSDLEKATGVNKSGLYSEFKDKEDIFFQSMKHYRDRSKAIEILSKEPLGWKNIETLLKASLTCSGNKGCLFANTVREYSIIPENARSVIEQNQKMIREEIVRNLKAAKTKKNAEVLASMIMTFSFGIALKLNAVKPDVVLDEIEAFLELLRS
jgi:AcrR family transcriptional regulator